MIVTCPSCSTRFTVDPAILGVSGRRVRCVRCGHVWHQIPEADAARPPSEADAVPERIEPAPAPPEWNAPEPEPEPEPAHRWGGWRLFFTVVFLLAVAVFAGQERIVGAWPAAGRLYETIGIAEPAPGPGLEIRDVTPQTRLEDGQRAIVVTGRVVNPSEAAVEAPAIRATLLDESGNVLSELDTALGRARLEAGEEAGFALEFSEPPGQAARVTVTVPGAAGD